MHGAKRSATALETVATARLGTVTLHLSKDPIGARQQNEIGILLKGAWPPSCDMRHSGSCPQHPPTAASLLLPGVPHSLAYNLLGAPVNWGASSPPGIRVAESQEHSGRSARPMLACVTFA